MTENTGHIHPMTILQNDVLSSFLEMGYEITEGPIMETDWYNFEALNMLKNHPARDMQDTFYLKDKIGDDGEPMVLRTQLSQVQVRYPMKNDFPFKIAYFGKVLRNEAMDATHEAEHSQFEFMAVGKGLNMGHLKGTIEKVLRDLFEDDLNIRLRPGYFPFVEPGIEVDLECFKCRGKNDECQICKGSGWTEIIGAGVMNPIVLKNGGINPDEYQGFAFAIGWDRLAMFKYGIDDIRIFNSGDLRLTNQF